VLFKLFKSTPLQHICRGVPLNVDGFKKPTTPFVYIQDFEYEFPKYGKLKSKGTSAYPSSDMVSSFIGGSALEYE